MPANEPRTAKYHNPLPARYRSVQSRHPHISVVLAEDTTMIQYDVRKPLSRILPTMPWLKDTSASTSVSPTIRIISPSFPWSVDIPARASCADVFETLHNMLQKPITDSEWGYICVEPRYESIMRAARERTKGEEVAQVKRIDWLGDKTTFNGFQMDRKFEKKRLLPGMARCPETWIVKFRRP
ncbi:hypothetical protein EDC04DRAFT_3088103 [Pisolithus marmoratus]|nr:hypothetical protein EDC04DRAFT_3088103 [Pisolithus marmoratus]